MKECQNEGTEMSFGHEGLEKMRVMTFGSFIGLKENKSYNQQREPKSA